MFCWSCKCSDLIYDDFTVYNILALFFWPRAVWIFKLIHDIDIIELVLGMQFGFGGAVGKRKSAANLNHVACTNLFPHNIIHIEEESQKQNNLLQTFCFYPPPQKIRLAYKFFTAWPFLFLVLTYSMYCLIWCHIFDPIRDCLILEGNPAKKNKFPRKIVTNWQTKCNLTPFLVC